MAVINILNTSLQVSFADPLPTGVGQYGAVVVQVSTGVPGAINSGPASPRTVAGLTASTQYRVYGLWCTGGIAVSDWIFIATVTTAP
jgi:hypothetical protein